MIPFEPTNCHWLCEPRPGEGISKLIQTWAMTPSRSRTWAMALRRRPMPAKSRTSANTDSASEPVNQRRASNRWQPMSSQAPPSAGSRVQPVSSGR